MLSPDGLTDKLSAATTADTGYLDTGCSGTSYVLRYHIIDADNPENMLQDNLE